MSLVLFFLNVGLPRLLGSLIVVENDEEAPHFANEPVSSHTIGRKEFLGSSGAVLADCFHEGEWSEPSVSLWFDIKGWSGLVG
jgi:hypothetical protein